MYVLAEGARRESTASAFDTVFADVGTSTAVRSTSPHFYKTVEDFWNAPMLDGPLTPRMRELVLLAMHGTSTALNSEAIARHVHRAHEAGATPGEIFDVLVTIAAAANHALYFSVPILEDELDAAGMEDLAQTDGTAEVDLNRMREDFINARGFWNENRESLARVMPTYFAALHELSTATWKHGELDTKEREFICVAIDCSVTHMFESGLRSHVRNALKLGATKNEILQIFQLSGLLGLEGLILAGRSIVSLTESV